MRTKSEIFKECQNLYHTINGERLIPHESYVAFKENVESILTYTDENDKWTERCLGTDECVTYVCIFVLCHCLIADLTFSEKIKSPEKFYNFVSNWFIEHLDHYQMLVERGFINEKDADTKAGEDCAKVIYNTLKNNEEDKDLDN